MLLVAAGLRVRHRHHDQYLAAMIAGAGNIGLLAVDDPAAVFEHGGRRDVGGVRRSDTRFRHCVGGANLSLEQGLEPFTLLFLRAEPLEHFHVAGVGGTAIEGFGSQVGASRLFGDIGVFDRRQAMTAIAVGQPEIPQSLFARLALQVFEDFLLPFVQRPALAVFDFGQELLFDGFDSFADKGPDGLENGRKAV